VKRGAVVVVALQGDLRTLLECKVKRAREFRLETHRLEVSRNERGEFIIRPIPSNRSREPVRLGSAADSPGSPRNSRARPDRPLGGWADMP
jgi:virulence-associated protein VagC